ncbi:single-stranded DNA-binding protein [Pseudoglutamicibacter cumminsii]|uniref:single-stranded DNA-binding protein n=1 Tax=Pseudoglutamicibacter cumminsii TaxID=156979 RepID=UPI001EF7D292|nr:single-stranded DNA-binding protein [Pseudoglutamicibacter cumminsii]MBM7795816.1 single-strand DNA-binding protein [Pseudoglutamicibacter cumminsii]
MTDTHLTIIGNLTADPELRFTQNGAAVVNFTVASTPRTYDKQAQQWVDGEALFMRCNAWREQAEHAAETLAKGMRVVVVGKLKARSYQDKEGNNRTAWELEADEIAPSLRYATANVTKANSGMNNNAGAGSPWGGQPQQPQPQPQPQQQGWDLPAGTPQAAPPF